MSGAHVTYLVYIRLDKYEKRTKLFIIHTRIPGITILKNVFDTGYRYKGIYGE